MAIVFEIALWFVLLFLFGGVLGCVCTAYFAFAKCVADPEKIEKRAIICLKRVFWQDVVLIRAAEQKSTGKQILLAYSKEKLLITFESPMKGMGDLLNLAKQKDACIQLRCDP